MKIGVCIKRVPDTATNIKINAEATGISEEGVKFVINPYDEFGIEEALQLKEKQGSGDVTALIVGPEKCQETLRGALALGCDKVVHIDTGDQKLDSLAVSKLLAKKIEMEGFDIVFTGRQAVDDDNAQVSQMIAELLSWPHVNVVSEFEVMGEKQVKLSRDVDGGSKEVWEVTLPAVVGASKGLNKPRYASLPKIMQAKSKPIEKLSPADLGVSDLTSKVSYTNFSPPAERQAGKMIEGDAKQAAKELVRLLREEAKVI